jgi:hypothetical protein
MTVQILKEISLSLIPSRILPEVTFLADLKTEKNTSIRIKENSCTYTLKEENYSSGGGEGGFDAGFNLKTKITATLTGVGKLKLKVGRKQVILQQELKKSLRKIMVGDDHSYVKVNRSEQELAIHRMLYKTDYKVKAYCDDREAVPLPTNPPRVPKKDCFMNLFCPLF